MIIDKNGKLKAYDDYYPYGLVMPGRSLNMAMADERYKFNGKELDVETGYEYYGARYYNALLGRWLMLDPMGKKYPNWNGYNYCLNNPINNLDPEGDTIWVCIGSERIQYIAGMKYDGTNSSISSIISTLNSIYSVDIGEQALSILISSKGNYNYTVGSGSSGEFRADKNGLGGTITLAENSTGNIEEIAHESFHAYRFDQGSGRSSVTNEVQSYLYGAAVSLRLGVSPQPFSRTGTIYENAMTSLLTANKFNMSQFKQAIKRFKSESLANYKGAYQNFKIVRPEEKYLIKQFYPLLR